MEKGISIFEKIKSVYILKAIFSLIIKSRQLDLIVHNKILQY